jgi:hypothetical protein
MRSKISLAQALLLTLGAAAACSDSQSYLKVNVVAMNPSLPIANVTSLDVRVVHATTNVKTLTYSPKDGKPFTIDATGTSFSVSFSGNREGLVSVAIVAFDTAGCGVGTGQATTDITKGGVGEVRIEIARSATCLGRDGGAGMDAGPEVPPFPGCDPAVAASCPMANQTCHVNCAMGRGTCTAGGAAPAGSFCQTNADCMPGTQCFDYAVTGGQCAVKVCLKFCKGDGDCAGATDGGMGAAGVCQGDVQCGGTSTGHKTCTFNCDPRGTATTATTGCPAGLHCFVVGDMDQVDCGCRENTRTKIVGETCVNATDCEPGLICNLMGATRTCRKICKRSEAGADCATGQTCEMLTNDMIYGVCL